LIAANAEVAVCEFFGSIGRNADFLTDGINHDEVIAKTMHFGEAKFH
jgi:hypothetical protein